MGTHQDSSAATLKTLADAITQQPLSQTLAPLMAAGSGFDVNAPFQETRVVDPGGTVKVNGVSLVVDVEGSVTGENGGKNVNVGEANGSVAPVGEKGNGPSGGNRGIEDLNGDGMMEMEGGDDGEYMEEHGYSVGDLVWGKIKSHPWWPGQIYDPSDASDVAVKYNQKGRLLVAYFGDGSFAWCLPSQLIPFAEHFEEMSKQSSSKTFVNAVQEAVDEIGRLVEVEMTCSCVSEEKRKGLTQPLAVNAGIKAGVLVPGCAIGKLLSFRYDPAELLATVANAAESVSFASMLELSILKSSLSAFYRARGGYSLPMYYEPLLVEGLEDKSEIDTVDANDFSVPIEVPLQGPREEDWLSAATAGTGNGQAPSEDKIYQRRKQKSVAELMAESIVTKPKNRKRKNTEDGATASNSVSKKKKPNDEVGSGSGTVQASSTGRKRGRKKDEISNVDNGIQREEQMQESSLSSKLKQIEIPVADSNNVDITKGSEDMSSPRERKKSKYLSPPYTSPRFRAENQSSKKEIERESEKVTKDARMGERMTKAAEQLLESTPVTKYHSLTVEKNLPKGYSGSQTEISADLNSQTAKLDQKRIIGTMNVNASVDAVLSGVKSVAVDPLRLWDDGVIDLIRGFISAFRSAIYFNGANYKVFHKRQPGRKRKSLNSESENLVNDLNQTGPKSPVALTGGKKSTQGKSDKPKKNTQESFDTPKLKKASESSYDKPAELKKAARGSSDAPKKKTVRGPTKKANDKEVDRKAFPTTLIVTFAPGFSLPSKEDIIKIFSKFGDLNEEETDVFSNSCSVQIVYMNSSGAEEGLRAALSQKLFGTFNVNYKLSYSSSAPVAVESGAQNSSLCKNNSKRSLASQSDEVSQLGSMRQKLEIMTSMLEKCDGKISTEVKSNLDGEIMRLLEKVRTISETASS